MRLKRKHIAAIALSVAICVGATGCKSEEVKNTEKLIRVCPIRMERTERALERRRRK